MNKVLLASILALGVALVSSPAMARRGADDPAGHVRGGGHEANEHANGHDMNEHANGHDANEHANGHDMNEHANGHDEDNGQGRGRGRGRGGDDGPNHE